MPASLDQAKDMKKEDLAKKWVNLKNRLSRVAKEGEAIAMKTAQVGTNLGGFAVAYYWRRRRQLAGKKITFDKKGRVDAFFWPGLGIAAFGVTPLSGEAGPYMAALGSGVAAAGMTDFIAKMAQDHHDKK